VELLPLRNDTYQHPLDVAAQVSLASGWPVWGVGNIVWLNQFAERANAAGASMRFFATSGNATFSASHSYAAGYYLRSGRPWRALWLLSPQMRGETPIRAAVATRLVQPLRHPESVRVVDGDRLQRLGVSGGQPDAPPPDPGRGTYLRWLTARLRSQPAATNPATSLGNLVADPFASRTMIQLAAAIEPGEWQRGYQDRALARRLSRGRVTDPIRLRRTRGGQGRDTLHVIRRHPDRLLDSLAATPPTSGTTSAWTPRSCAEQRQRSSTRRRAHHTHGLPTYCGSLAWPSS
jgi:hypothetical protein